VAGGSEGRLKVHTGSGGRAIVTRYRPLVIGALTGVVLAVPRRSPVCQYAVGHRVTLEVVGRDDDGGPWAVRIIGLVRELDDLPSVAGGGVADDFGASGEKLLFLPADHVGGSVSRPCDSGPEQPGRGRND